MEVSFPTARAWGVECDSWKGSRYAHGAEALWTAQVVRLGRLLERPGNSSRNPKTLIQVGACSATCARCNAHDLCSVVSSEGDKRERYDILWKPHFRDHTGWSDNRHQKRHLRLPDFRHRESSSEAQWLKDCYRPAWVDPRLVTSHARMAQSLSAESPQSFSSDRAEQTSGPEFEKRFTLESVKKLCQQGQVRGAIDQLEVLVGMNYGIDKYLVYSLLKECMVKKDLMLGGQVHALAVKMGFASDTFLSNHFIRMYAIHGKLKEAMDVFKGVTVPDAYMWSSIISAHVKQGQAERAIELYQLMRATKMRPDSYVLVAALQACAAAGDLQSGKQVHDEFFIHGMENDMFVCNSVVDMFAKCGSLKDARRVFDSLCKKNVVTWSVMIAGYARVEGMGQEALKLYSVMLNEGMAVPDSVTFVFLLQACANVGMSALEKGRHLHSQVKERKLEYDVGCSLVNMYVKCGSLKDARVVFDGLGEKDVVTWTAMIAGYAQQEGMGQEALQIYFAMRSKGMASPNAVTYVCVLQACANVGVSALETGKQLHLELKDKRLESDVVVGGSLVNMYGKCGSLKDARIVFDGLREKNVVTWAAMLAGYSRVDMGQEALDLHCAMQNEGITIVDAVSSVCLLQACAGVGGPALETGKQLHSQLRDQGRESEMVVGGSLVNMYVKCGSLKDARLVFDRLGEKNVVSWTAMIAAYAQQEGMGQEALNIYGAMQNEGMTALDAVTFACLLRACADVGLSAVEIGKEIHSQLEDRGLVSDVGCSLVNMYAKCGSLKDARRVFDDLDDKNVVTWSAMIAGYARIEGMGQEALNLYGAMQNEGKAAPDAVTYVCLLQACANVGMSALEKGKQLHSLLKHEKLEFDVIVGGSLVNMYAKCASLKDARIVFDGLVQKNVVTWNAMISGYAQHEGMGQEALNLYSAMQNEGITTPNAVTYVCLLQACASVGALQQGMQLHSEIREGGLESNVLIGNCLVKMYAKCGRLEVSREVFDRLPLKDLVTWNALLKGYAEHGEGGMAIQCFEELLEQGVQPDEVTYTCLFTACSHAGLVDQGQQYFKTMVELHGIEPNDQHYCCMVDLLGRTGHVYRAEQMLQASGLAGNVVSWTALLSACKSYGDAETGMRCFDHLVRLEPTVATAYVLLGSIYANAGRWDEVNKVESNRKAAGATKKPAKACIEVRRAVHEFTVGEERADVAAALINMNTRVKEGGHVPQTHLVLCAVSEQEKADALCGHAEKLALAYGLLNTVDGSPLLVIKNLRMCNDCHSSTKVISRMENRAIVVRDGYKVHRFHNGACSCQDKP